MAKHRARGTPCILGLTGGIACGKTTVGDLLLRLGAIERIDADHIVHQLQSTTGPVLSAIVERFGTSVLAETGGVDRGKLADIVFRDQSALRDLEAVLHPAVRAAIRERLDLRANQSGVMVIDAVKLLQSDLLTLCDDVWVVHCHPESQWTRLVNVRGLSEAGARARLAVQPNFSHPAVSTVIDNSGTMDDLERQVAVAWHKCIHERCQ